MTETLPFGSAQGLAAEGIPVETSADSCDAFDRCVTTSPLMRVPIEIDVVVPIREFRVLNLLSLEPGQVIASGWPHGEDLPLGARCAQLAWAEFEVIEEKLAVRITRLV